MAETIKIARYHSPVGEMIIGSIAEKLCISDWSGKEGSEVICRTICRRFRAECEVGQSDVIQNAIKQLDQYFNGSRVDFTIPVVFAGTSFQCAVWAELLKIPYGETISYAEQARRINNPKAVRAVAAANARNHLSIIVPCHRVIGSDKKLTGYGGGLRTKAWLLDHEARISGRTLS